MKRRHAILLILATLFLVAGGVLAWNRESVYERYRQYRIAKMTSSLPHCDRVEVYSLDGDAESIEETQFPVRPYQKFSRILDRTVLTAGEAENLASLWRSQVFDQGGGALCHYPGYGFRFYQGSSLVLETSLCFECENFYLTILGESEWHTFNPYETQGAALLHRLQEIFPASIPKPQDADLLRL